MKAVTSYGGSKSGAVNQTTSSLLNGALVAEGMVGVAMEILRQHGFSSSAVAELVLPIITMFSVNNEDNRVAIGSGQGLIYPNPNHNPNNGDKNSCELIIRVVHQHAFISETIAESGLRAIINLALSAVVRSLLATAGACELVVEILNAYIGKESEIQPQIRNINVIEAGCKAVNNLAYSNLGNTNQFCSHGIAEIITTILKSIDTQNSTKSLTIATFQVISGLCYDNDDAAQLFLSANAVEAVERILGLYEQRNGVQDSANTTATISSVNNEDVANTNKITDQTIIDCASSFLDILVGGDDVDHEDMESSDQTEEKQQHQHHQQQHQHQHDQHQHETNTKSTSSTYQQNDKNETDTKSSPSTSDGKTTASTSQKSIPSR